jgi:hypothetical protein
MIWIMRCIDLFRHLSPEFSGKVFEIGSLAMNVWIALGESMPTPSPSPGIYAQTVIGYHNCCCRATAAVSRQ